MPTLLLNFEQEINVSAQVGDNVYYISPNTNGEFDWADISNIIDVGYPISSIANGDPSVISIDFPAQGNINIPPSDAFIMFGKDNTVNVSSLSGYYAEVEFRNDSNKKVELFSVGSDISESSK
tara:strand:+ start:172 stop:540 length:369 start_codon:yes stop_codon:yes gene_type:complete